MVIQGASITEVGSSTYVNGYTISGFDADGEPTITEARTVPFDQTNTAGCSGNGEGQRTEGDGVDTRVVP